MTIFKDSIPKGYGNVLSGEHEWKRFSGELEACNCVKCLDIDVCAICGVVKKEYDRICFYFSIRDYELANDPQIYDISCGEAMLMIKTHNWHRYSPNCLQPYNPIREKCMSCGIEHEQISNSHWFLFNGRYLSEEFSKMTCNEIILRAIL